MENSKFITREKYKSIMKEIGNEIDSDYVDLIMIKNKWSELPENKQGYKKSHNIKDIS